MDPLETHPTLRAIQTTTQDVEYYALGSLNLSKFYISCTFEFLISATPHLQSTTSEVSSVELEVKHHLENRDGF
jgi:hypothetical protein